MKRIYKYITGEAVPEGAIYLASLTNGDMPEDYMNGVRLSPELKNQKYVWHYFLVEVNEDEG